MLNSLLHCLPPLLSPSLSHSLSLSLSSSLPPSLHAPSYGRPFVSECVRVWLWKSTCPRIFAHREHLVAHTHTYVYVCVCVCRMPFDPNIMLLNANLKHCPVPIAKWIEKNAAVEADWHTSKFNSSKWDDFWVRSLAILIKYTFHSYSQSYATQLSTFILSLLVDYMDVFKLKGAICLH